MTLSSPLHRFQEKWRPQFHFTPEQGWMNDPNGLVYYAGEYHLFYQYLPGHGEHVGNKHWGHAVSPDLVRWEHLPIALFPDERGEIWSGSVVVDHDNTSGLQTGTEKVLVALFTHHNRGLQTQSLAYSNDRGRTWTPYPGNPVIPNPGLQDFRDPKVFWHAATRRWVMVLVAGYRVMFYSSPDLINWDLAGEFGLGQGAQQGVWECPDLFELAVDGDPRQSWWVLLVSVNGGAPNGGSGTQYFVGTFDGRTFTNSHPPETTLWLDFGRDNYASVTFSDLPPEDGRRIALGWMSNWWYGIVTPTSPWRGSLTVPRELSLVTNLAGALRLRSQPLRELAHLRRRRFALAVSRVSETVRFPAAEGLSGGAFELLVEFGPGTASEFGLSLCNDLGDRTVIGYHATRGQLFLDRYASGAADFHADFPGRHFTPPLPRITPLRLQVLLDRSSVEMFANDGRVLTDQVFPYRDYSYVELYASEGDVQVKRCDLWELASIWRP